MTRTSHTQRYALLVDLRASSVGGLALPRGPANLLESLRVQFIGGSDGGFDEVVTLLEPDAGELRLALRQLAGKYRLGALGLVYFLGHALLAEGGELRLLTSDVRLEQGEPVGGISAPELFDEWEKQGEGTRVLILDAQLEAPPAADPREAMGRPLTAEHFGSGSERIVFSAFGCVSGPDAASREASGAAANPVRIPGAFSELVLDALALGSGSEHDEELRLESLLDHCAEQMREQRLELAPQRWNFGVNDCPAIAHYAHPNRLVLQRTPKHASEITRELSQALELALLRRRVRGAAGLDTSAVERDIVSLQGRLRAGGILRPGDWLAEGRYLLLEPMGARPGASVWRARDLLEGRQVALRLLYGPQSPNRDVLEQFRRSVPTMAALSGAGVVEHLSEEMLDGELHLVALEYMNEGDLLQLQQKGRIGRERAIALTLQIGSILEYAHRRGFAHGRLEPRSIFVDADGRPRVADFSARPAGEGSDSLHAPSSIVPRSISGLPASGSVAPSSGRTGEAALARGIRRDIHDLGMVVIFLLHGAELPHAVFVRSSRFLESLDCNERVRAVLRKVISDDLEEQYVNVRDFCNALAAAAGVPAPPPLLVMGLEEIAAADREGAPSASATDAAGTSDELAKPELERKREPEAELERVPESLLEPDPDSEAELERVPEFLLEPDPEPQSRLEPESNDGRESVTEFLPETDFETDESMRGAVEEQRRSIEADLLQAAPYHALFRLFRDQEALDECWCVAATLVAMEQADREERRCHEKYRPRNLPGVTESLQAEEWEKWLRHPEEDVRISRIFELVAEGTLGGFREELGTEDRLPYLDPAGKQNVVTSTLTFAKIFHWAAAALGVHTPDLYVRHDTPGGIVAAPTMPPCTVVGMTLLTGYELLDLSFAIGKHLSSYRWGGCLSPLMHRHSELAIAMYAALLTATPAMPLPAKIDRRVRALAKRLPGHLQGEGEAKLAQALEAVTSDDANLSVKSWFNAAEHTSCRAGFLLSGDLRAARKMIQYDSKIPGHPSPEEKFQGLLRFSISDEYFALRRAIGVSIGS